MQAFLVQFGSEYQSVHCRLAVQFSSGAVLPDTGTYLLTYLGPEYVLGKSYRVAWWGVRYKAMDGRVRASSRKSLKEGRK